MSFTFLFVFLLSFLLSLLLDKRQHRYFPDKEKELVYWPIKKEEKEEPSVKLGLLFRKRIQGVGAVFFEMKYIYQSQMLHLTPPKLPSFEGK